MLGNGCGLLSRRIFPRSYVDELTKTTENVRIAQLKVSTSLTLALDGPKWSAAPEVCTGLRAGPCSTNDVRVRARFGPGPNYSSQTLSGFVGLFSFRAENVTGSCAHLKLVTQSGSGNKCHCPDSVRDFLSFPSQKELEITLYRLQTSHVIFVPFLKFQNNVTRFRASLCNSFEY